MISYENYKLKESVSNRKPKKHSVAFFERGSWYHRTKVIDENGKIKYGKKGGFFSQKEAEEDYWICLEKFEQSCLARQYKNAENITLSDYLKLWFENEFSPIIQNTR